MKAASRKARLPGDISRAESLESTRRRRHRRKSPPPGSADDPHPWLDLHCLSAWRGEPNKRRDHGKETLVEIGRSYNVSGWTISRLQA